MAKWGVTARIRGEEGRSDHQGQTAKVNLSSSHCRHSHNSQASSVPVKANPGSFLAKDTPR